MRGTKGQPGAAETACSVLGVMLELELRSSLATVCVYVCVCDV